MPETIRKYDLCHLSSIAQHKPGHLREIILGYGIAAELLDERSNMDLIDAVCSLQDGKGLPDWARKLPIAMTLNAMIAAGNYDRVSCNISEKNFPIDPSRFTMDNTKVFHFGREITTEEVGVAVREEGYGSAGIEPLLVYGAENPEEQVKHPIAALGASWVGPNGNCGIPYLHGYGGGRSLNLDWGGPESRWYEASRFLAVRKSCA